MHVGSGARQSIVGACSWDSAKRGYSSGSAFWGSRWDEQGGAATRLHHAFGRAWLPQGQGYASMGTLCEGKGVPSFSHVQPSPWEQDFLLPASAVRLRQMSCAVLSIHSHNL